ncbi:class I SAM-dependent methyltransferase [Anoxybacillus ayderensis G10]|uniref:class I SAM-dependent methyltransferase n=1 Tax=Anoxybacillus gonensis TaxID=198467 RepID=UPI00030082B5|nr:class I SAM-dependent methyltransferase [Anoxybacillus ayderensis G10]
MIRKIGNVILETNYYLGMDLYSDGQIEDEILEIIKNRDEFTDIIASENRWPILYHLSPERHNLLEWMDFKEKKVLEIGAGCGAITTLLVDKAEKVVATELSLKRAEITAYRCKKYSNLRIIVGDFNDIKFSEKFDVITVIGVLEYAGIYSSDINAYESFLKKIYECLNPNGTIILAIENKFGLKYWAGAREDHTGIMFDSLQNYHISKSKIKTFSKNELEKLLNLSGFQNYRFYYPYPDYKLPKQIFSDYFLPSIGQIVGNTPNYDSDRFQLFDEQLVFENIIDNKMFPFFSNSFLIIAERVD